MEKTIKMYLESNPGFNCLLITDGNKWLCFDESQLPVELSCDSLKENAEIIKAAIASGDLYDAEDFWHEYGEDEDCEYHIKDYDGMSLADIDHLVNYEIDPVSGIEYPRTSDLTTWTEIKQGS